MIYLGENPEGSPVWNKYVGTDEGGTGYGERGYLMAVSPDRTEGLMESQSGELLVVRELEPNQYPAVVRKLQQLADMPEGWQLEGPVALSPDGDAMLLILSREDGQKMAHVGGIVRETFNELDVPTHIPGHYKRVGIGRHLAAAGIGGSGITH